MVYGVGDMADETFVYGEAYDDGEKAFCHAVGHIGAIWFTPFGDDVSFINDETGGFTAIGQRSDGFVVWFFAEGHCLGQFLVAWHFGFVVEGEFYGGCQGVGVEV